MRRTVAIVTHAAGHNKRHHIDLPPDDSGAKGNVNKTGVQAAGSTNAYARRYLSLMIFNVSTEDDNDGNTAGKGKKPENGGNGAGEQRKPEDKTAYTDGEFAEKLKAWDQLMADRKKTAVQIIMTVQSKRTLSPDQIKQIRDKEPKE